MEQEKLLYKITLMSSFMSGLISHKGLDITDEDIQNVSNLTDKVINYLIK